MIVKIEVLYTPPIYTGMLLSLSQSFKQKGVLKRKIESLTQKKMVCTFGRDCQPPIYMQGHIQSSHFGNIVSIIIVVLRCSFRSCTHCAHILTDFISGKK